MVIRDICSKNIIIRKTLEQNLNSGNSYFRLTVIRNTIFSSDRRLNIRDSDLSCTIIHSLLILICLGCHTYTLKHVCFDRILTNKHNVIVSM
jgi:hypothetical protein